jgi:pilus assembly protein CpaF
MHSETLTSLTERARALASSGVEDVETAISQAIDEAFESSITVSSQEELALKGSIKNQLVGLGSLQHLIQNPEIEEIWINSPDQVFIARGSNTEQVHLNLTATEIRQTVERMLRDSGRRLDRSEPFVDATLQDGSRLHVAIPDVTRENWAVNIRKFPARVFTLADMVNLGSINQALKSFLEREFIAGTNILVSGATQAGKTTMLCALLDVGSKTDRLISVEETFEIRTNYVDWVAMQARQANLEGIGEITLRRLVREALRMRPTRLVIGEVRQAEALDLLIALNSGIAGLCTIHANSAAEALSKMELLPLLAGENIPAAFVSQTVNRTIGLVVHCGRDSSGNRRVTEVLKSHLVNQEIVWSKVIG